MPDQGKEYKVVIFSTTRSNFEGHCGFVEDPGRLCVSLSRAEQYLFVVGDARTLCNRQNPCLSALVQYARGKRALMTLGEVFQATASR